jgi:NhaA family Na+:H+ antiporter
MWWLLYQSGIHPTITGILLAFALPFGKGDEASISYKLQHWLHIPVAFVVLPLFALANTAIVIPGSLLGELGTSNTLGIIVGLLLGKPAGIFLFSVTAISLGWASLSMGVKRVHLLWLGFLAGIGFTMSIFITLLAFDNPEIINVSKIAIIIGSVAAATIGFFGLKLSLKKTVKTI